MSRSFSRTRTHLLYVLEQHPWAILAPAYGLVLVYLSLFPFDWHPGKERVVLFLPWPKHLSRADVLVNVIAYAPFGFLLALCWRGRFRARGGIALATLIGSALSVTMEYLQVYVPERDPSLSDALFNSLGTFCGALAGSVMTVPTALNERLHRWRYEWFQAGNAANLGLTVMGLWALAQLLPLVPSPDMGTLKQGLRPVIEVIRDPSRFNWSRALVYGLDLAGLGNIALSLIKSRRHAISWYAAFIAIVLLLKVIIVTRQLSLEACLGAITAILCLPILGTLYRKTWRLGTAILLMAAYWVDELRPSDDANTALIPFNWFPFGPQLGGPLTGMIDIAETVWPFAALAYLSLSKSWRHPRRVMWLGGMFILIYVSGLEGRQAYIPGRHGDITTTILAIAGWGLAWRFFGTSRTVSSTPARNA